MWKLSNTLHNNYGSKKKSKGKLKSILRQIKGKHNMPKLTGCSKSSSKREIYSKKSLPQETRRISNKQSNLTPKGARERRTNKTQS